MVSIYYTQIKQQFNLATFKKYLEFLPKELQIKNARYFRWQDQHSNLLGKMLLIKGLMDLGYDCRVLSQLKYNKYSRPYLENIANFTLSHSGEYVVCGISREVELGIDIEALRQIILDDYSIAMTEEQWNKIKSSSTPENEFFNFWTIKESVLKALGNGLSIPLTQIIIDKDIVMYKDSVWYTMPIPINKGYCCTLSTNKKITQNELVYNNLDFYSEGNLLK